MTRKKSEDAVSPVIGVMLMLVVVIIIAAVVTVFATGTVAETEVAPIAKLDVKIISDQPITGGESIANRNDQHSGTVPTLHLTHVSGDSLNTANLKLSFSWECDNPDCTQGHQHTSTYQAGKGEKITPGTSSTFDGKAFAPTGYGDTVEPLYINYGKSSGGFFGNHILKRGETMIAFDKHLMVPSEGAEHEGNPAMDVLFNNGKVITEYDATRTETQTVTTPGTPADAKFAKYGDITHTENCAQVISESDKNRYYERYKDGMNMCGSCFAIFPCPLCGKTSSYIFDGICTVCGDNFKVVSPPKSDKKDVQISGTGYSAGIMACLTEGTAVKVIITHTPSNKVIYEDRVFVE